MTRQDILAEMTALLQEVFDDPDMAVTERTSAKTVAGWDSMKQVMVLIAVEEKFRVRLTSRETDRLQNVGDLVSAVESHLARV